MSERQAYQEDAQFWRKTSPKIFSDIEVKPTAARLLSAHSSGRLLEAGCGSGYVARIMSEMYSEAEVYGCDHSEAMIQVAEECQPQGGRNIRYCVGDILGLESVFEPAFFDAILSSSVVLHLSPDEYTSFLEQARLVLKPGGSLVISTLHPFLFSSASPTRGNDACWVKHHPLELGKGLDESQQFAETLFDCEGKEFHSTVWYHSVSTLLNRALAAELRVDYVRECYVTQGQLISPAWGTAQDYPAYFQFRLRRG